MTTPIAHLPFRYGRDRSLVDTTRIRWGGFGDVLMGVVMGGAGIGNGNVAGIVFGLLFVALGIATWSVTSFGSIHYLTLSPGKRAIVVLGSIGFIVLLLTVGAWLVISKIIELVGRR